MLVKAQTKKFFLAKYPTESFWMISNGKKKYLTWLFHLSDIYWVVWIAYAKIKLFSKIGRKGC
jgi:hypothetical protein